MRIGGSGEGNEAAAAVGFACTRALMQATAPVTNPDPDPDPTNLTLLIWTSNPNPSPDPDL